MVAVSFTPQFHDTRWLHFVAISFVVNMLLISAVKWQGEDALPDSVMALKLNVMAVAAPSPTPVVTRQPKAAAPQATPPVVTKKHAPKHVQQMLATTQHEAQAQAQEMQRQQAVTAQHAPPMPAASSDSGNANSTVLHEAHYRSQTPPVYPRRAYELGQQGTVILHAEVTASGHPDRIKLARSSGYRLLDHAAMAAVKEWEFEPTRSDGTAIHGWVKVPVKFIIRQ